ncbi:hypothetical protein EUTSA_v10002819mg, partial [Eutrema salsugineum]
MATAMQVLVVQRPPPPVAAPVAPVDEDDEEDENPFAALRDNPAIQHLPVNDFNWENGFKSEIPEFHGGPTAEELLDWIVTMEEIMEFKHVPLDRCVPVLAMRFRGRATAWWAQLKATRTRLGKPK